MSELKTILESWRPKTNRDSRKNRGESAEDSNQGPLNHVGDTFEIPDIFFDRVLVQFKLSRMEILVIVHLYRSVWSRPNLYREYGISPMISYSEISKKFNIDLDDVYQSIRKLESFSLLETIRPGQYFVRRFFLEEFDNFYGQSYGDFE